MKTTLNNIQKHSPCEDGWKKLLLFLGKTKADDEELSLLTILKSNGLQDALWALMAVDGFDREKRLMACDFADEVVHLTNDARCINAIEVSRDYAYALATDKELKDAYAAASASYSASYAAAYAAYSAAYAASVASAASDASAAASAASDASAAASYTATSSAMRKNQIKIFKKYMK